MQSCEEAPLQQLKPHLPMMNATLALSTPAQQAILYAAGPFYGWPWKPTLNEAHGCSYAVAYAHVRRDHNVPYNLVLHGLCLVMQLLGNFHLLTVLDARFSTSAKYPVLRVTTAIAWIAALALPSECPAPARALSVAAVVAAATLAPRLNVEAWWTALPLLQLTIGAAVKTTPSYADCLSSLTVGTGCSSELEREHMFITQLPPILSAGWALVAKLEKLFAELGLEDLRPA